MMNTLTAPRTLTLPREADLDLRRLTNDVGLSIAALPNGCLFAIEDRWERGAVMINRVLGSPLDGGIARLHLRLGPKQAVIQAVGPGALVRFGAGADRFSWIGEAQGGTHQATLWLHPREALWLWRIEVTNTSPSALTCDAILVQDIGLAPRGFLMNGEAYASQYVDHHVANHPRFGPVIMSRQNLKQAGMNPWVVQGCLDGAAGFATDAMQVFGARYRDAAEADFGVGDLPSLRLQHEVACVTIQSRLASLAPGESAAWTFFGRYERDHPDPSGDADLARVEEAERSARAFTPREVDTRHPARSVIQDAAPLAAHDLSEGEIAETWPERQHEEWRDGRLLSFFTPDPPLNRHVVLREKEGIVARPHGALLRSGQGMLLDERTLCATCWMSGVFAAQLMIGNTSLHKLFSVSRDSYNIGRTSGLRILVDEGAGWHLLTVPSAFDIGLSDCRWIYKTGDRAITVHAIASGSDAAMLWRITVEGQPCRFLVFGHLVLGERELDHAGRVEIDLSRRRFAFRPDPASLWGQRYPQAVYHLVTSTSDTVDAIGGDELLYDDGESRGGAYAAIRTSATREFSFAVVGSMTDAEEAETLAEKYARGVADEELSASATGYWRHITRGFRLKGDGADVAALDTIFPWLAHDAMIHLTVPHGLEQYTGAAWGTRDVCQGPVEFLLALEHDREAKEILRIVFAEQSETDGDWPQWFMLPPYSNIRDSHSHGDVIVWPLKALCDYVEATNDLAFLDELAPWRRPDGSTSDRKDPIAGHIDKLLATCRARFIAGTHLMRYGEGDWNDSLQPAHPELRERMVSSWTVALFFQQLLRYAEVLRRADRTGQAAELDELASAIREDFNRHLIRDGTVAGYAIFASGGGLPELLIHPSDTRTGLKYALLPMKRSIIAKLFTPEQTAHHLNLIRERLLFPDGARLMDRPVTYRGGVETVFRRAESSSFFGREIGLMYVHAHLRYCEALATLGEAEALWEALLTVNPIAVTDRLGNASLRQRNAYFSSSDAAFPDRYQASAEWERVKAGTIAVDGGWRVYSSGPGLTTNVLIRHILGRRRYFGERLDVPLLPASVGPLTLELQIEGRDEQRHIGAGRA